MSAREKWTPEEAAAELDGCKYGDEGSPEVWARLKAAGLVAVFGASDDLMELRGAIDDEVGCYDGGQALITPLGLFNPCECDCLYSRAAQKEAAAIDALWNVPDEPAWTYEADFPHSSFKVMEGGAVYCRGIVFSLTNALSFSRGGNHAR